MRPLNDDERRLISSFAEKLDEHARVQLIADLGNSTVADEARNRARIEFAINGYERPPYSGQHSFGVEGRMLDCDEVELTVTLYADQNGRLLDLEFIRWDSEDVQEPRWETLRLWA